ncbi:hypothetical protein B0T24DRAFT_55095 [Lasiosphaeria ovina]|uniref:Uncharacterized protein n=1 Tax=Lasiosphaeria ovina TaxID=92902 RepID=A0AAE0NL76_9PEZI|nr:hypothetical protein B0T24DRAFT_55095 [Lasiosphaeria ovina]
MADGDANGFTPGGYSVVGIGIAIVLAVLGFALYYRRRHNLRHQLQNNAANSNRNPGIELQNRRASHISGDELPDRRASRIANIELQDRRTSTVHATSNAQAPAQGAAAATVNDDSMEITPAKPMPWQFMNWTGSRTNLAESSKPRREADPEGVWGIHDIPDKA